MKTRFLLNALLAFLIGMSMSTGDALAQCTNTSNWGTWNGFYSNTTSENWLGTGFWSTTPTSVGPGQYITFPNRNGGRYIISTCGNGSWRGYDTQLTVRRTNNQQLAYNDDQWSSTYCGLTSNGYQMGYNSRAVYTSGYNEYVRVHVNRFNCQPNAGGSSSVRVRFRQVNNLSLTGTSVCEGSSISLPGQGSPDRSGSNNTGTHQWGNWSGTGTINGSQLWVAPSVSSNNNYTVTYRFGACNTSATFTSLAYPNAITSGSGDATPCIGQATTYTCGTSGNATSYQWLLPPGWSGSSTTNTITVTPNANSGVVRVRGVNGCGNGPWRTVTTVNVIDVVGPPSFVTGTAEPCENTGYTYSVVPVTGATSYQWTLPSGWSGSSTGVTITATPGAGAASGNVVCRAVNDCGAGPAAAFSVSPLSTPAAPGTISGDNTPCVSSSQTYSVTNVSGMTYNWTLPAGWTLNSGAGTNSVTVSTGASGGTISVTANNGCFTSSASTLSVSMTTVPAQPGAIAGNASPCEGVATTYSISPVATATSYSWTLPSGWTGSSTGVSISATNDGSPGTILVAAVNDCGAGTTQSLSVDPVLDPVQPTSISGNTSPCAGTATIYSCPAVPEATTYNWSLPSGWVIAGGFGTNSITVGTGTSGGTISVTAQNSCSTGPAQTLAVSVIDVIGPPGAITGETSPCQGTGYTYSISPVAGATSYQWTAPAGWSGTSTGTTITLTPGGGAASGNVSVSAVNTCGAGPASDLAVTVISTPATPSAITGTTAPCNGQTYTYSVTNVPGMTYNWSLPAGYSGSSTTNSISVTAGPNPGTISVTATNSCSFTSSASSLSVTPDDVPAIPGAISGDATPCIGSTETYSIAAVPNTTSYEWVLPGGWSGTSTTNSITVTVGSTAGDVQVRGVNGCGNGAYQTLSTTPITTLGAPISMSGSTSPCVGTATTYSVPAVTGATSYQWTLPGGWTGSSTGLSISATPSATAGNVTCQAVNDCGLGVALDLAVVPVDVPATPGSISGDVLPCIGGSYTYSVAAVPTATSYNWTLPAGWTGVSTTNSITVTVGATGGTISVSATNACFTGSAQTLAVGTQTVLSAPGAIAGNTAPCEGVATTYSISPVPGASSYQWTLPSGWTGSSTGTSISATPDGTVGNVSVQAVNVCGAGASSDLAVDPILNPVQPTAISGNTLPCIGFTETYSVPAVPEATSYNWTLPGGWTGTSTTNSISVTVGATGGTISVTASNSCSTSSAQTLAVGTQDVIGPPGAITGNALACISSSYTYSIAPVAGASSYQWTLPAGWSGSSTGTSISAIPGSLGAGTVSVQAVTVCGAGPSSDFAVEGITTPIVPASISGPTPACIGVTNTYTVPAVASATTYNWTFPAGWSGPVTTAVPSVDVVPSATAGTILVSASNSCGTSANQSLLINTSDVPVAGFSAAPFGVTATYTDTSSFDPTSWVWDFGDGNGSTDQNPFHYYGTGGSYTVCLTATNSCGTSATHCETVVIPDYNDFVWTGAVSTDWETAGNWSSNQVPFGDNVFIPNVTNDPVISTGQIGLVNNITMNSGATLAINGTGELRITGNWEWPGFHTLNGTVRWNGFTPQPQSVDGDIIFENMIVENSVTLNGYSTSSAYVGLTGGLTVDGGDLVTNGLFTVVSDASGTGWIDPLVNGGTITGDVTVERYIPTAGFHYIGSPINSPAIATELTEYNPSGTDGAQLIASSNCSSDSLAQGSPYGNILEFNESNSFTTACSQWGWNVRSSGTMTNGRGYSARKSSAVTVSITGTPNDGNITYAGLGNSGGTYGGFHIVSNPYPSPMLWSPPSGFGSFIYMWQTSGQYSGTYQAYGPGTQVASTQGFFAYVPSGTATYSMSNSDRTTGDPTFWRYADPISNAIEITVKGNGLSDRTMVALNNAASEDWDSEFDAYKIPGNTDRPHIYTRLGDGEYSVNSIPDVGEKELIIPVGFTCGSGQAGVFDFEFSVRSSWSGNLFFVDRKTGNSTRVRNGGVVRFSVDESDDTERFALHFNPTITSSSSDEMVQIYNDGDGIVILGSDDMSGSNIQLFDLMGRLIIQDQASGNIHRIPGKDLVTGTYVVKVTGTVNEVGKVVIR